MTITVVLEPTPARFGFGHDETYGYVLSKCCKALLTTSVDDEAKCDRCGLSAGFMASYVSIASLVGLHRSGELDMFEWTRYWFEMDEMRIVVKD